MGALDESHDVHVYLRPLKSHFEEMEENDFLELYQRLSPMFHCVCLAWANCQHYQQPARIVVLLQEISNLMIGVVSGLMATCMHVLGIMCMCMCMYMYSMACTCTAYSVLGMYMYIVIYSVLGMYMYIVHIVIYSVLSMYMYIVCNVYTCTV